MEETIASVSAKRKRDNTNNSHAPLQVVSGLGAVHAPGIPKPVKPNRAEQGHNTPIASKKCLRLTAKSTNFSHL